VCVHACAFEREILRDWRTVQRGRTAVLCVCVCVCVCVCNICIYIYMYYARMYVGLWTANPNLNP